LALTLAIVAGCNRSFYRQQADREAIQIVREHAVDPRWPLEGYTIGVDPNSRMFDPFSPDHPPMPPDDPASHRLMHCVDGKKGWPGWEDNGLTDAVENPMWRAALPWEPDGTLRLDADQAVRLALLHSTDFQEEIEELYLSALDVSFERFRFDHQFFGGYSAFFTADGRNRPGSGGESASFLDLENSSRSTPNWRLQKLHTTGAEMVVGFANSLVWQFSGDNTYDASTLLDFTIIQPLLRGAGRDRVMERLTISERTLLANVRQMERFRQGFYLEIVTGRNAGDGPSRRGGFFGGSGLEGFTGVGGGGFGRVGGGFGGAAGGAGGIGAGAGAPEAGGFFGLLQDQQELRNQESNIAALRNSVTQLEAFFRAGRIDYFQVELARQALLSAQSVWLNSQSSYQANLDDFKRDLGLPPDIEIHLDDELLQQFDLLDPTIVPTQNQLATLQQLLGEDVLLLAEGVLRGPVDAEKTLAALQEMQRDIEEAELLLERVRDVNMDRAMADIERLRQSVSRRRQDVEGLIERTQNLSTSLILPTRGTTANNANQVADIVDNAIDMEKLEALPAQLTDSLQRLSQRFDELGNLLAGFRATIEQVSRQNLQADQARWRTLLQQEIITAVPNRLREFSADVLELSLIQARARTESIALPPIDLDWVTAYEIASQNRLDWMNNRAGLVDAWRLIQFNADSLESELDIVFSGDVSNRDDNPFSLDSSTGRLRVGLQFDAPITRLAERNTYRQALIEYQQAKRSYYRFRDGVAQGLRATLRTVELNRLNFELLRSATIVAIAQVELAGLRLQEPPKPNQENIFGATTARDLVSALADLLQAQNNFLSVWVNYEVLRRSLDYDLGTMRLDSQGLWIDPGPIEGYRNEAPMQELHTVPDAEEIPLPLAAPFQQAQEMSDAQVVPVAMTFPNNGPRRRTLQRLPAAR
jgi:hypothetical protein